MQSCTRKIKKVRSAHRTGQEMNHNKTSRRSQLEHLPDTFLRDPDMRGKIWMTWIGKSLCYAARLAVSRRIDNKHSLCMLDDSRTTGEYEMY